MDVISLKKYIFENEKIEYILGKIGCQNIRYHPLKEYFSATQPDGDNVMGVVINNDSYLGYHSFSRNIGFDEKADIITLIGTCRNETFQKSIKWLHQILGLNFKWIKSEHKTKIINPINDLARFREDYRVNVSDVHILNEEMIHDYVPLLYIGWLREGVFFPTAKKFGIAYSYKRKRVIIPHRYWLTGELVGFNARTTVENYEEFGIKKYWITPSYQKSLNIYGLWEHYQSIQKAGYVTVFESEKSVLKRDSLLDETGVAISGKVLSDEQVRILIGLNVNIVFAMDKDVNINEVRFMCEKFNYIRNVFYLHDKWDLLGKKDSPCDAGDKAYRYLFEHRIKYDEKEHMEYLKSFEKR